jgi:hypothetical protein
VLVSAGVSWADLPPNAAAEVDALLEALGASRCEFYRNGRWYGGRDAQAHLRTKLDYLVRRRLIHSTEEFIEGAAERSSMSGQPYKVRCPGQPEQPSAQWLRRRLVEMRTAP